MNSDVIPVVPTYETDAYSDQDQFGSLTKIPNAVVHPGGKGKLVSVTVIDNEKIKPVFDVLLFSGQPTVTSVDNAALDISDTELASKFLGRVVVASGDWEDLNANSFASIKNIQLKVEADAGLQDLWMIGLAQGSIDFASTTPLTIKFGIEQN